MNPKLPIPTSSRFGFRPQRSHPRPSSTITSIYLSFVQYGLPLPSFVRYRIADLIEQGVTVETLTPGDGVHFPKKAGLCIVRLLYRTRSNHPSQTLSQYTTLALSRTARNSTRVEIGESSPMIPRSQHQSDAMVVQRLPVRHRDRDGKGHQGMG